MIRTFVAIEPPPGVREELARLAQELGPRAGRVRWARPGGMHLTLKFLGDTRPEDVAAMAEALVQAVAGFGELELALDGLGRFPAQGRPRVVWAGLTGQAGRLAELAGRVEEALSPFGYPPEKRPFSPHLTLGRVEKAAPALTALLDKAKVRPQGFTVRELAHFRSTLTPRGAIYDKLTQIPIV